MAQLNPNFEIDFSDINSYEQIQLINDTQLAKENLLMHRAYKEPSDDEIIRNHFSSFTFVDFCPKLFTVKQKTRNPQQQDPTGSEQRSRHYELESFSDLFERINSWLKLNKNWRVVSMETLVYDCQSQFNHIKSSVRSCYLPQNTRGLRLFLSPSKSRFSGPQKIGCINVVPRKVSGSYLQPDEPIVYETLDEILNRLNELLLTRPIEGRILSVETITLPMMNGYVNTESNYFVDSKLNQLNRCTYSIIGGLPTQSEPSGHSPAAGAKATDPSMPGQSLIDILRVYYEFGPMVCGLVNLIDFVPRFYSQAPTAEQSTCSSPTMDSQGRTHVADQAAAEAPVLRCVPKIAATESLTRLVRRSLAWFEDERKLMLKKTGETESSQHSSSIDGKSVNLKVCNLQVHQKTLLKNQLIRVTPENAISTVNTRNMVHGRVSSGPPITCELCSTSSVADSPLDWCSHLIELSEPYQLKFVRLAYVVPVYNRSARPLRSLRVHQTQRSAKSSLGSRLTSAPDSELQQSSSSSSASSSAASSPNDSSFMTLHDTRTSSGDQLLELVETELADKRQNPAASEAEAELVDFSKPEALDIVRGTNARHAANELAHQLQQADDGLNDSPIGQLSYRLFAPCQLVNSSSCFSINPVNSSSPLARRGSLAANGSGISSENANPSTSLLAAGSSAGSTSSMEQQTQQVVTSFGAFFPALSYDVVAGSTVGGESNSLGAQGSSSASATSGSGTGNRFTTNEFEPVDAIRRRMEVYVTTNSMKVIAGETLVVNLSDSLSCLSTAIEQTVVKASVGLKRAPSTWVSVYVLYAAVDEPQLPKQLLAQQKMRELTLISEEKGNDCETNKQRELQRYTDSLFSDDFNSPLSEQGLAKTQQQQFSTKPPVTHQTEQQVSSIRIEQNNDSLTLYNSAYDRTVALPTQPENIGSFDPVDLLGSEAADRLWPTDDNEPLAEPHGANVEMYGARGKKRRSKKKSKNRSDDTQCSIM